MAEAVGTDLAPRDAEARVMGTLPFVLDHRAEQMLHAKTVRSLAPHGRITAVEVAEAQAAPGVVAVVTGLDLARDEQVDPWFGTPRDDQPVLAMDKVHYAGDPVAVVVAETSRQAADAALLVDVEYDDLPYVVDADEAAQPGAPTVHDRWPDNACGSWALQHGEGAAGMASAAHVFSGTFYSPPASHVPMEPHVCVAEWRGEHLEVWSSCQSPHLVRQGLQKVFRLPDGAVRVRTLNLGGAFGAKGQVKIEPMVAYAARGLGRPLRMELARDEVFMTVGKHAARVDVTTGVDEQGRIVARTVSANYNAGAYAVTSVQASGQALTRANGPYRIPHVAIDVTATYTNTVPTGPFRGAMTSQLAFAYESQMDEIAAGLGIDPVELRRRNVLRDGDVYPTGEVMHDMRYADMLDDLAGGIGWGRTLEQPADPRRVRARGLAVIIKNTLSPSRSEAALELTGDGAVRLLSSSVEMGQGAGTTILQIAADELGVDVARIESGFPDTDHTPFDTITASSRTTYAMGEAIADAARDLRSKLAELAAGLWGCEVSEVGHDHGAATGDGGLRLDWVELLAATDTSALRGDGVFASDYGVMTMPDPHDVRGRVTPHYHQGGAAAEVEVDLDTGRIEVLRVHVACFAGRVVSPLRVRQQNQGCAVMGLGPTLFEAVDYLDGTMNNPNLSDYMIPSIVDVPTAVTSTAITSDDPAAELHGVGEMAMPGIAPAVANAVSAATGVRLRELPLTPERVLRALDDAAHDAEREPEREHAR